MLFKQASLLYKKLSSILEKNCQNWQKTSDFTHATAF
jgi:hypothetical protein